MLDYGKYWNMLKTQNDILENLEAYYKYIVDNLHLYLYG